MDTVQMQIKDYMASVIRRYAEEVFCNRSKGVDVMLALLKHHVDHGLLSQEILDAFKEFAEDAAKPGIHVWEYDSTKLNAALDAYLADFDLGVNVFDE